MSEETLSTVLHEAHSFEPSEELAAAANGKAELYAAADADYEAFWAEQARRYVTGARTSTPRSTGAGPPSRSGTSAASSTRHTTAWTATSRPATATGRHPLRGRAGRHRTITYADLHREVQQAANALESLGVAKGDRVAIYMPMIPETVVAMLACARIGAPHSVVFGGFSAEALHTRIADAEARVVITSDGGYRRGAPSALKPAVDAAVTAEDSPVEKVLVVRRTGQDVAWDDSRDVWWHEALEAASDTHEAVPVDSEHPLFILYTSGTTGKPKGIFHTTGGYLAQCAYTNAVVHDLHPETDVYWCTADVGWVTGHSYIVYGPLANGATQVMYEGTPDSPHQGRWWEIVEKYKVSILYTAPTAIRTFMKWGDDIPARSDLSSLRVLGSVGEPINPEAWLWYRKHIGGDRTPIVDTWWQTETGAIMISPFPASRTSSRARRRSPSPASAPRSSTTRASRSPRPRRSATSC